jgi:hypothetical protein
MNSYFEIGGRVVESYLDDNPAITSRPHYSPLVELGRKYGVSAPLVKMAGRETKKKYGRDPVEMTSETYGRARRAKWAFRTAAILAAADGPLPIGDIAAIGVLGVYGTYELYKVAEYVTS